MPYGGFFAAGRKKPQNKTPRRAGSTSAVPKGPTSMYDLSFLINIFLIIDCFKRYIKYFHSKVFLEFMAV
jgi:hypothetical protein